VINTLDVDAPTSSVEALPAKSPSASFGVRWAGEDVGSGVESYTVLVSVDGGPFAPWLTDTTLTSATFSGEAGHSYGFASQARDLAGNRELLPAAPDAETRVEDFPVVATMKVSGKTFVAKGGKASISFVLKGPAGVVVTLAPELTEGATWLRISAKSLLKTYKIGKKGTVSGKLDFVVDPCQSFLREPRRAVISLYGAGFTVTQAGLPCRVALKPSSKSFKRAGGESVIQVTAPEGCGWTASLDPGAVGWVDLVSGEEGTGSAQAVLSVPVNQTGKTRSGKIVFETVEVPAYRKTFTVKQGK
jgi:hypothetical protein